MGPELKAQELMIAHRKPYPHRMQKPWIGRTFFTGSAMTMPMTSLHIGQRRMSRFAADRWEPILRITPRTGSDCRAMSSTFFDNKLLAPKKDG
jgi:hypothetical protein